MKYFSSNCDSQCEPAGDSFFSKMTDSASEAELLLDDSPKKSQCVSTRVAGSVKQKVSHDIMTIPIEDWNYMKDQNARILAQLSQHDFDSTTAQSEKVFSESDGEIDDEVSGASEVSSVQQLT